MPFSNNWPAYTNWHKGMHKLEASHFNKATTLHRPAYFWRHFACGECERLHLQNKR